MKTRCEMTCNNCRFYMTHLEEDVNGAGQSECRRYPPAVLPNSEEAFYPIVREADWCGEFQTRPMADSQAAQLASD